MLLHHNSGRNVLDFDQWISDVNIKYKDTISFAVTGHTYSDQFQIV